MSRLLVLAFLLISASVACTDIFGGLPLEYADAEELSNDSFLKPIWRELESCSGRHRSFDAVDFYWVPHDQLTSTNGVRVIGQYFPNTNRIYVIQLKRNDPAVLRHEMMHALLRDIPGHPPEYFSVNGRCGTL